MLLLVPIVLAVFVWIAVSKIARQKRSVKAADFLSKLDAGATVSDANAGCEVLFTKHCPEDLQSLAAERANREAALYYNGKQMPVIKFAISKGFEG